MLRSIISWWRRRGRRSAGEPLHIILYTRKGCHLCEDAWQLLAEARESHPYVLEAVDVDGDTDLAARYGEQVPVVTVNGKVRFRGVVNGVLLRRLLRAELRS